MLSGIPTVEVHGLLAPSSDPFSAPSPDASAPPAAPAPIRAALVGVLAFPWVVHAAIVAASAAGARPLEGRAWPIGILAAAIGVAALAARRALASSHAAATSPDAVGVPRAAALVLTGGGYAAFLSSLVAAVSLPVVAYDALAYRLPVIADWLDAGRVAWVATDDPVRNGYPLGQEAISAVVAAATGSFRFTAVTSFLFVAAGALAIRVCAEACGVRRAFARAAASTFLLVPMVVLNAPSGYVDAAFAGAVVALVCLAALLEGGAPAWVPVAAGMAAAHVLALKGNGVAFVAVVLVAVAIRAFVGRERPPVRAAAAALTFAAPGAFWAARNLAHTGNPLWPVELRVGPLLLPGIGTMPQILDEVHNTPVALAPLSGLARVAHTWFEWSGPATDFDDRTAGLGLAWPLIALPAVAIVLAGARGARRAAPVLFVLAVTAACFAIQPMRWWPRYTVWLWAAGALAIATGAEFLAAARRTRALSAGLAALAVLAVGEGAVAILHANGAGAALSRGGESGAPWDPRSARNATSWVEPSFWSLGLDRQGDVCRGSWKPATDNANLDGVFAQLSPRPHVHVVPDDDGSWERVRGAYAHAGCSELLLFRGSPVLPLAARDPAVTVEPAVAFDPLFVVRPRAAAALRPISSKEP